MAEDEAKDVVIKPVMKAKKLQGTTTAEGGVADKTSARDEDHKHPTDLYENCQAIHPEGICSSSSNSSNSSIVAELVEHPSLGDEGWIDMNNDEEEDAEEEEEEAEEEESCPMRSTCSLCG